MTGIHVRRMTAADVRPLRAAVLRPTAPIEKSIYPGDDDLSTFHAAAFDENGTLMSVGTVIQQPPLNNTDAAALRATGAEFTPENAWRLRGMASLEEARGKGFGKAALLACIDYVRAQGGAIIWCYAREEAVGFYLRLGYVAASEPHPSPDHGDQVLMWVKV